LHSTTTPMPSSGHQAKLELTPVRVTRGCFEVKEIPL